MGHFGRFSMYGVGRNRLYCEACSGSVVLFGSTSRRAAVRAPTPDRTPRPMDVSQFLVITGLIFVNGFFVAAEFALVKVRTSQIDQLVEKGNWAAKLTSKALDHLDAYLSASQLGITVASLALGYEIDKVVHSFASDMGVENWRVGRFSLPLAWMMA